MRLSVCLATERGIDVGATVHDALFYTAPADSWEEVDAAMKSYRFSEDLDFTLRNEDHLDEEFLQRVFEEIGAWVTDQSGLTLPADQLEFDIYDNSRGRPNCQGKIAYDGPVSPTSGGWPKIKLDLTADERLVLPSVRREVFHPYSDRPEDGIWANCYAYEEAFEEKLRALGERTRPRDLMTW